MRLLTVLLFGVFLVATQVFLVLKAMQDNLFERNVDPVDAVMERQASISDELTPQERLWLSKNHTVRVGVDPDFYPLEKFDAEGRYTGIGPDYLRILHKMTGISVPHRDPPSDWTNTTDMATSHKVDMYIAAAETQHRSQYMLFTPSYIVLPGIIVTRQPTKGRERDPRAPRTNGAEHRRHQGLGRETGRGGQPGIHGTTPEELHPEIRPCPSKNTLEGLQKVAFGEVDAMIDYQFNITEKSTTAASATSAPPVPSTRLTGTPSASARTGPSSTASSTRHSARSRRKSAGSLPRSGSSPTRRRRSPSRPSG